MAQPHQESPVLNLNQDIQYPKNPIHVTPLEAKTIENRLIASNDDREATPVELTQASPFGSVFHVEVIGSVDTLSKRFEFKNDQIIKEPAANFRLGAGLKCQFSLTEFAQVISGLGSDQAIILGTHKHKADIVTLASKHMKDQISIDEPVLTRTKSQFEFKQNAPGFLLLDHDSGTHRPEQLMAALEKIEPGILTAPQVIRGSVSSGVSDADATRTESHRKFHIFLGVANSADIPRAGQALHERLILQGQGRAEVFANGHIAIRSLIDEMVWQENRLVFEGAAEVGTGLQYTPPTCQIANEDSQPWDSRQIASLTIEEQKQLEQIKHQLRAEVKGEADQKRQVFLENLEQNGVDIKRFIRCEEKQTLPPDFQMSLASGEQVSVATILETPEKYHKRQVYDLGTQPGTGKSTRCTLYTEGHRPALFDFRSRINYLLLPEPKAMGAFSILQDPASISVACQMAMPDWILKGKNPKVCNTYANAKVLMDHLIGDDNYFYDVIKKDLMLQAGHQIIPGARMSDLITSQLESLASLCECPSTLINTHLQAVTKSHERNPLLEAVTSVPWDGCSRFEELERRLGSQSGSFEYRLNALKYFMIGAVAAWDGAQRTPNPKAQKKFEYILTLRGAQGVGKTSFFTSMMPGRMNDYLMTGAMLRVADRDSVKQLTSMGLVELGELDGTLKKNDIADLKAFTSKTFDTYRPAFGRHDLQFPRRTLFVASVNPATFLRDPTGSRRFFVLDIPEPINLEGFDVMQLWAEAWHLYLQGEPWWPNTKFETVQYEVNNSMTDYGTVDDAMIELDSVINRCESNRSIRMSASQVWQLLMDTPIKNYEREAFIKALQDKGIKADSKNGVSLPDDFMQRCNESGDDKPSSSHFSNIDLAAV